MKRLFAPRAKPLLVFGLLSAALLLPHGGVFAADPNHVAQLRETKKCERCDLSGASLSGVDLSGANLQDANLTGAILWNANLTGALLAYANLTGAILPDANLTGVDLTGANLTGANLQDANLTGVDLTGANLSGASLSGVDLSGANLQDANLTGVELNRATLTGATLRDTNLTEANLTGANLSGANLQDANLTDANLRRVTLSHALFEPVKIPPVTSLSESRGLHKLRWERSPQGLVLLRNAFKDAGMRQQEREVAYSQMRWQRRNNGGLEGALQFAAFEATSAWGMAPARPLWILLGFIPVFALLYMVPIARPSSGAKLWRVWDKDRAEDRGQDKPEWLLARGYRIPLYALFFSVLSAFHIGWKELSIGSWIARLNPYEYTLKATGWARTVSGVQSLISVYLLALAVLTYFGRPFE